VQARDEGGMELRSLRGDSEGGGMRYLVTGGAGFIGSHLVDELAQGSDVLVFDDFSTGSHRHESPRVQRQVASVLEYSLVEKAIRESDFVFHLAASVGVREILRSNILSIKNNVEGTSCVLEAASESKKPVLIASTSEVYGKSEEIPFLEDADLVLGPTTKGRWSYAASKALDEFMALAYHKERGLPVIVVRLFNTVGPRQVGSYGMVLPGFISQALAGEPITVYGSGEQKRCFCDVRDTVKAIMLLSQNPKAFGEVVNIGSEREISINELAEVVKARTGSSSPIVHIPYSEAYDPGFEDIERRVPCLDKLVSLTGFKPQTSIEEIVDRMVEHMAVPA